MVKFALLGSQTYLDVSQALSVCQLSEGHAEKLIEACEVFDLPIAMIPVDALPEGMLRQEVHDLRENESACKH